MDVKINRLDPNVPDPIESRRRAAGLAVRQPPALPIARGKRYQRDRKDAAPDVEADAEIGRQNARRQQLEREYGTAGDKNDRLQHGKRDNPSGIMAARF